MRNLGKIIAGAGLVLASVVGIAGFSPLDVGAQTNGGEVVSESPDWTFVDGNSNPIGVPTYIIGSGEPIVLRIDKDFEEYFEVGGSVGLGMAGGGGGGGMGLVINEHYTASVSLLDASSTVIVLITDFLDAFGTSTATLVVTFNDGTSVMGVFYIQGEEGSGGDGGNGGEDGTVDPDPLPPNTAGDILRNPFVVGGIGLFAILGLYISAKKQKATRH